jgi:hypothetical protein
MIKSKKKQAEYSVKRETESTSNKLFMLFKLLSTNILASKPALIRSDFLNLLPLDV